MRFLLLITVALKAQSFEADLQPIFRQHCYGCHAANVKMGSLDVETHEGIMRGGNAGTIVVPGKAGESRLYLTLAGKIKPQMPMGGQPLAAGELEIVKRWIDNGAKPDPPSAKKTAPIIRPKVPVKPAIYSLAWNNNTIAAGGFHQVRLFDGAGKPIAMLDGHLEAIRAIAIGGNILAAAGGLPAQKGEAKIWDLSTRQLITTINAHTDCIYAAALSPDGTKLATASYDKMIYLWDPRTGAQLKSLKDHIDAVYALAFTPDGKKLVSAGADRTVKIWNSETGERLYTFSESTDGLNSLAISPGGKQVAAAGNDKTIRIWTIGDTAGSLKTSLIAHEDTVLRIAWSPDGKRIATASADRSIKLFNAEDLSEIQNIPNQPEWVTGLQFSPDSRRILAFRQDGSMQFYETK
ncbi:MAG: PD40 domain-containing protein [Acidobacteria bacterium]|nr:PD40 domain-containing protein [Acidobacteriota bacterium]